MKVEAAAEKAGTEPGADEETDMGSAKVKIDKDLYAKVKKLSETAGYSSPDEFVAHCLEREIARLEDADSEEEIRKKLKGLGYIS